MPLAALVEQVGGHPNTTRGHLDVLRAAGLVRRVVGPSSGRGRPPWLHSLTDVGRSVVRRIDSTVGDLDLDALALAFVRHLRTLPDPSGTAREVGRGWAASLGQVTRARTRCGRAQAVIDRLDRMGFTPVRVEPPGERGGGGPDGPDGSDGPGGSGAVDDLILRSCPLLESAGAHPEVVCQIHLGLVEGLLESSDPVSDHVGPRDGPPVRAELEPWGRPEGCRLLLVWGDRGEGEPDKTEREGIARDGTGRDETGRDETGWEGL